MGDDSQYMEPTVCDSAYRRICLKEAGAVRLLARVWQVMLMLVRVLMLSKVQHSRAGFLTQDNTGHTRYRLFRMARGVELQK